MAITVTDRGTHQATAGTTTNTKTSSSFSPANGSILVVAISADHTETASGSYDSSWTVTDALGTLTWTQRAICTRGAQVGGSYRENVVLYTSSVVSGSPTGTVTVTEGHTWTDGWLLFHVWEVGGQAGSPIGHTASPSPVTSGTTFNTDLGATPATDSTVFGIMQDDAGTTAVIVQPSGWTESDEVADATFETDVEWAFLNGGSVQSPQWSGMTSGHRLLGASVEILAAATSTATVALDPRQLRPPGRISPVGRQIAIGDPSAPSAASTSASAGVATATATANVAAANVAPNGGLAQGTGTANAATASVAPVVGRAQATGTANNATTSIAATAGRATATATANNATVTTATTPAFPTTVSSNGRYILDQYGTPWMMHGDAAWSLAVNISLADAKAYIDDRANRGINAILVNAVEHLFATSAPANFNGDSPFSGTAFQTSLVSAYWAHLDEIIGYASVKGITVILFPAYLGFNHGTDGWWSELAAASNAQVQSYGASLAARYATAKNIIWAVGGDYIPTATEIDRYDHILQGIQGAGDTHLATAHLQRTNDSATSFNSYSWLTLNAVYTGDPTCITDSVTAYNRTTVRPTFAIEPHYQFRGSPYTLASTRLEQWQVLMVGGLGGHMTGNESIWSFGYNTGIASNGNYAYASHYGDQAITDAGYIASYFTALGTALWTALAPDLSDVFLTSGELSGGSTQAAASYSTCLGLVYVPTNRSVTINLAVFTGHAHVRVRWYDVTAGTYVADATYAASGTQAITHPGNNSSGDADWLLVADITDTTTTAATATATANAAKASVAASAGIATATATANNATCTSSGQTNAAAGSASATGTANNAVPSVAASAGVATATATANNATCTVPGQTNAQATTATATATALTPGESVSCHAGVATATATAFTAPAAIGAGPTAASATATANLATLTIAISVAVATAVATGRNATTASGAAPDLTRPLSTTAVIDGRSSTTATTDGRRSTA